MILDRSTFFNQQDSYRTGLFVKKNHFHMHCVDIDSGRGCELHLRNIVLKDLKEIHYAQRHVEISVQNERR